MLKKTTTDQGSSDKTDNLVVKGRKVSAYPAVGPEVTIAEGIYVNIQIDGFDKNGAVVYRNHSLM
ncbi:MAG: hypothetical protein AUJ47_13410 [Candidatus Marinimicrobia bacterium CG1_02_48_14]|nr:MAG: hypothetical protein AUJ47_13410 [Candidatus Marinimicrobia bacterium CG1_02_48_14]PJA53392.1 MAG: hypothetical protein CO167_07505 [Candidatus Marinimicrobia bacterium CG_4_9_14_3_um_filter_48_9]